MDRVKTNHGEEIISLFCYCLCAAQLFISEVSHTAFYAGGSYGASTICGYGTQALPSILYFGLIETGLREEIFFRGFLLKRLQTKLGFWVANIIQALLFALPHSVLLIILSPALWFPAMMAAVLVAPMAMLFGYISERSSGGSIIPLILIHGLGNVAVAMLEAFGML